MITRIKAYVPRIFHSRRLEVHVGGCRRRFHPSWGCEVSGLESVLEDRRKGFEISLQMEVVSKDSAQEHLVSGWNWCFEQSCVTDFGRSRHSLYV